MARIKAEELRQAQRFARERPETFEAATNGAQSKWDALDAIDHNLEDLLDEWDAPAEAWLGDDG